MHKLSMIGTHNFRKVNAVTQMDEDGQYDTMKCTDCGIEGKCRDLATVEVHRMTKKANYCIMKDADIKKMKASAEYNSGIKTKYKCPICKNILSEIALYEEDKTDNMFAEMVCVCGYKDFIDVTEREKNKKKPPTPKRFLKLFEQQKKENAKLLTKKNIKHHQ